MHGKVANDCETEQIVGRLVDSFPPMPPTSKFVGVSLCIGRETSVTMPKPPILISRIDPAYVATQEHFADLLMRYNLGHRPGLDQANGEK